MSARLGGRRLPQRRGRRCLFLCGRVCEWGGVGVVSARLGGRRLLQRRRCLFLCEVCEWGGEVRDVIVTENNYQNKNFVPPPRILLFRHEILYIILY